MTTQGPRRAAEKILTKAELCALREDARAAGRSVVHCHGCFDIVHPGHLRYLRHAKAQGDLLLVSITGDALIAKGSGRPLIPQELRAENLAALDCVDWVFIDPHATAVELLEAVRPDVYVKGREYESNNDPRFLAEKECVLRHGGRTVFSSGDVVFSSTALIAALEQSADPYHARLRELTQREELSGARLNGLMTAARGARVLVIGEPILDTYVLCDRPDVAGESPIMTLRPIERRFYDGGAAIIAKHLAACGAIPTLVTALDTGPATVALKQRLLADGVNLRELPTTRPLPEKQRFLVGAQKMMKLDLVTRLEPDAAQQMALIQLVRDVLREQGGMDAVIIADFGLGLLTGPVLQALAPIVRDGAEIVTGDVSGKRSNLLAMRDFDLLCPNESELREATRQFDDSLPAAVHTLLKTTGAKGAMVTMGAEGLIAFERLAQFNADTGIAGIQHGHQDWTSRLKAEHVPAMASHGVDTLGCGDALVSVSTLALLAGGSMVQAALLGAAAAGVQANRLGNTTISSSDVRSAIARLHTSHLTYVPEQVLPQRSTLVTQLGLGSGSAIRPVAASGA